MFRYGRKTIKFYVASLFLGLDKSLHFYSTCNILLPINIVLKDPTNQIQINLNIVRFWKVDSMIYQSIYHRKFLGRMLVRSVLVVELASRYWVRWNLYLCLYNPNSSCCKIRQTYILNNSWTLLCPTSKVQNYSVCLIIHI